MVQRTTVETAARGRGGGDDGEGVVPSLSVDEEEALRLSKQGAIRFCGTKRFDNQTPFVVDNDQAEQEDDDERRTRNSGAEHRMPD